MPEVRDHKSALGIPLIIGAVLCGLVAAVLSFVYLKSEKAALLEKYAGRDRQQVVVVVAAKDLPKGSVVRQEYLSQRQIPAGFVADDAIGAAEYEKYLGRVLEVAVGAGKPLLKSYLDTRFPVDFSDIVPVGRRAMTVQVDDINSIAGFIRPGNHVDLFVNIPSGFSGFSAGFITADLVDAIPTELRNTIPAALLDAARGASIAGGDVQQLLATAIPKDVILPVLQNVRVLATGRDPYREELDQLAYPQPRQERNFNSVTLDLSPREAALVSAAIDKGDLLALLRNRKDEGTADFSTLSAQDLFSNAFKMAKTEDERRTRVAAAGGVDGAGNLVDADGKIMLDQEQLRQAGLAVNDRGELVDRNGRIVDPRDVVVTADGRVLDRKQLAAAGLTVTASGQIVDRNGRMVSADDIVTAADGKVLTRQQLAASGLAVNAAGEVVDGSGRVVDTSKLRVAAAGGVNGAGNLVDADGNTLLNAEQLRQAGLTVNAQGQLVDKHGRVVDPRDVVVTADGRVLDRKQLAAAGLTVTASGQIVDSNGRMVSADDVITIADGKVLTRQQLAAAGLAVNAAGEVVDGSGRVVDPSALITTAGGRMFTAEQLAAAGLKVNDQGEIVDASGKVVDPRTLVTDASGRIVDSGQLAAAGLKVNAFGQVVDQDGNVVDPTTLVVTSSGVLSRAQLDAAGLKVDASGNVVDANGRVLNAREVANVAANTPIDGAAGGRKIGLIIGGSPSNGMAKSTTLKTTD